MCDKCGRYLGNPIISARSIPSLFTYGEQEASRLAITCAINDAGRQLRMHGFLVATNFKLLVTEQEKRGMFSTIINQLFAIPVEYMDAAEYLPDNRYDCVISFTSSSGPRRFAFSSKDRGRSDGTMAAAQRFAHLLERMMHEVTEERTTRIVSILDSQEETSFSEIREAYPELIKPSDEKCIKFLQDLIASNRIKGFIDKKNGVFIHETAYKTKHGTIKQEIIQYSIAANFNFDKSGVLNIICPFCGAHNPQKEKANRLKCKSCQNEFVIPEKILSLL